MRIFSAWRQLPLSIIYYTDNSLSGADNDAVHRLPRADLQQLLCVPRRERRCRRRRQEQLLVVRRRPLVGGYYSHDDWLWRHSAAHVDGQDCRVMFQRFCHFVLCSSSCKSKYLKKCLKTNLFKNCAGHTRFGFCTKGATEAAPEALQPSDSSGGHAYPKPLAVLRRRQEFQFDGHLAVVPEGHERQLQPVLRVLQFSTAVEGKKNLLLNCTEFIARAWNKMAASEH